MGNHQRVLVRALGVAGLLLLAGTDCPCTYLPAASGVEGVESR